MAGAEHGEDEEVRHPPIEDPFERMAAILAAHGGAMSRIYDELAGVGDEILVFQAGAAALVTNSIQQHVRLRVRTLIYGSTVNARPILTVGSTQYQLLAQAAIPTVMPFPIVVDRGMDIGWTLDVNPALFFAYVIGRPE